MIVYFNLKDKKNLVNLDEKPEFLSPSQFETNLGYDIDPIIKKIYRELYNRSFGISGLNIEFSAKLKDEYNDNHKIEINRIEHEDFNISFCGYDTIYFQYKEREIHFYSDSSPTVLHTYVGKDWEEDKKAFFNNAKVHSKKNEKKRIYLTYKCENYSDIFVHDDDIGREYSPEGKEPKEIKRKTEINKLKNFLRSLLNELEQLPESGFDESIFDFEKTPLKEPLKLTCFFETYRCEDISDLIYPSNRLISLSGATPRDGEFRDIYNDGFVYMELPIDSEDPINTKGFVTSIRERRYKAEVEIKYSDCVYVLDMEPAENFSTSLRNAGKFNVFGENGDSEEKKEMTAHERKVAYNKTLVSKMVKIEDYDGSFIKPIYITNRLIRKDEIKSVTKCKRKDYIIKADLDKSLDL